MLKSIFLGLSAVAALALQAAPREVSEQEIAEKLKEISPARPRLYLRDFRTLEKARNTPSGTALGGRIFHEADKLLTYPAVERTYNGDQMLHVSRNVLFRINTLALAYRLSGDRKYADKAVAEMRNAASFPDWNHQNHYLDTAEMTLAVALGYDWLYDLLTPEDRQTLETAIIEKGIEPSFANTGSIWWIRATNNWNQVCHAGMVAAAVAVFEKNPELAARTIARAINCLPGSLYASYYPRGAYPEGPVYWSYGSEFTVALLAILDSAFGTDFGLSEAPGFGETGDYVLAMRAPSGRAFSYADSNPLVGVDFAQVWLPRRFNRPDWMSNWAQQELLKLGARRNADVSKGGNRMLPLAMIFFEDYRKNDRQPPKHYFSGADAAVPVAMFRSDWTDDAGYLGVKAGSPSWAHAHMDAGSFVYDADGVRWAADLGQDDYSKFLARKMSLWSYAPNSDRWKIFRFGPQSHNILVIDGKLQKPVAKAHILECTDDTAVVELSDIYEGQADRVTRTFRMLPDRSVEITDRIAGARPGAKLRWQMLIQGSEATVDGQNLRLANNGKQLLLEAESPVTGQWVVDDAKKFEAEWDTPNPSCKVVAFEQTVPANGRLSYTVRLLPVVPPGKRPADLVVLGENKQPREERVQPYQQSARPFGVAARIRMLRKFAPDNAWKSCGIGLQQDANNQLMLSFCESPADSGSRHFLELRYRRNGQWVAPAGSQVDAYRDNFNWKYGEEYQLGITVSDTAVVGLLKAADGKVLAEITIPGRPEEKLNNGKFIRFQNGVRVEFTDAANKQ